MNAVSSPIGALPFDPRAASHLLEPVFLGLGESGLTPLQLVGRFARVNRVSGGETWCRCSEPYSGYAAYLGLRPGRVFMFSRVSLDDIGEWEARVLVRRSNGEGFHIFDDVELFRLLQWVELIPVGKIDPESWELLDSG